MVMCVQTMRSSPLIWLAWIIAAGMAPLLAHAQASSTTCCDFQGCFLNAAGANAYQKSNDCKLCNPCTATVQKLQAYPRYSGFKSPLNVFTDTQTCIAEQSCGMKSNLEKPQWLDNVLPAFVTPYVDQTGSWKVVEDACLAAPIMEPVLLPFRNEVCAGAMAEYHINVDLQNALNTQGCGTDADWKTIGTNIAQCTLKSFDKEFPGIRQIYSFIANKIVQNARDSVRARCIAYRTKNKLPIDVN